MFHQDTLKHSTIKPIFCDLERDIHQCVFHTKKSRSELKRDVLFTGESEIKMEEPNKLNEVLRFELLNNCISCDLYLLFTRGLQRCAFSLAA